MPGFENDYPIYNGIAPSWADFSIKFSGSGLPLLDMRDIAAVHTGRSVEVGEQRAPSGVVIRRTTGSPSQEASVTLYRAGFQKFARGLALAAASSPSAQRGNQARISLVHFNIDLQWTPPGEVEIYHRIVKGGRVIGDTMDGAEGTDADQVEVPISTVQIVDIIDGREVVLL